MTSMPKEAVPLPIKVPGGTKHAILQVSMACIIMVRTSLTVMASIGTVGKVSSTLLKDLR